MTTFNSPSETLVVHQQYYTILDGGLAAELETQRHNLSSEYTGDDGIGDQALANFQRERLQ